MSKINKCPFCGGEVDRVKGFGGIYFFECRNSNCRAIVSFRSNFWNKTEERATEAFNRRAD